MMLLSAEVLNVTNINWLNCASGVVIGLFALKGLISIKDWFVDRFGITTKKAVANREEQEVIASHEASLNSIVATNEVIVNELSKLSGKIDGIENRMDNFEDKLSTIELQGNANREANIMEFADRLEQKSRFYIETLHGIPENEYKTFVDMFTLYDKGLKGNHGVQNKVNYCLEHLPIIPSTLFVMRDDK